ncbi:unnamed protein product [Blumeria hordei]|uniref:Oxidoreductase-like domain-containing protein n=2 Tax=Blumeria hordei TaxID=2867405 RepID=A0A383UKN1_BLUHO|nr:hypothetical protein BGHDH14_bgh04952 [Blumeria hordei DH14]SZF00359.1 unnamed protein product [Blumeria hordei]
MGSYLLLVGNRCKLAAARNRYTFMPPLKVIVPSYEIYSTSGRYASIFAYSQYKTSKTIPRNNLVGLTSSTLVKDLSKEHIQAFSVLSKSQTSVIKSSPSTLPKPTEPDNCCMGGCVNCVWDRYHEEVEEWTKSKNKTNVTLENPLSSTCEPSTKEEIEQQGNMVSGVHQTGIHAKSSVEVDLAPEDKANSMPDDMKGSEKVSP